MCSEIYFKEHPSPHILPLDSDLEEKNVVPLDGYDDVLSAIAPTTTAGVTSAENIAVQNVQQENPDNRSTDSNSVGQSQNRELERKVTVLNESIRAMVDCDLIDKVEAYRFLFTKLSELTSDTT